MSKKPQELQELGIWKVGLPVLIRAGGFSESESITKIVRITDARDGTIYAGNLAFTSTGRERTSNKIYSAFITPATDEDYLRIRGKNAQYRLSKVNWQKLDYTKAIEIESLLNANGVATKAQEVAKQEENKPAINIVRNS